MVIVIIYVVVWGRNNLCNWCTLYTSHKVWSTTEPSRVSVPEHAPLLATLGFCSFSLKNPCLLCLLDFLKSQQSKCTTIMETVFYIFNSLFTLHFYLLDSSFVTSVSAKFTVALGASPTCAKSTSAPYQFTAFTTCIHVTEEHLDTITIIEGAGFILGAGLDSDFTTFLE